MTKETNAIIPFDPAMTGLTPTSERFQLAVFSERRERALCELRTLSGVPELARSLKPDHIYRLVVPEGKVLQKGKDGLFRGVVYRTDGKISQHAKFERVPPNLARVASAVGTQIMLVNISMQLNRVEEAITAVSEELHNDRIGYVLAGVRLFQAAMDMEQGSRRDGAILNAIQSLDEGLAKITLELGSRIRDLPEPTNSFWDNWDPRRSKAELTASKLRLTEDAFKVAVHGASVLAECYAALQEPRAGIKAMTRCLEDIHASGIPTAAEKARLAEVQDRQYLPETPWLQFDKKYLAFTSRAKQIALDSKTLEQGSIAIDFQANELMEEL